MSTFAKPQIIPHLEKSVEYTLFSCEWVPCSTRFITTGSKLNGQGIVSVYSMGSKEITKLSESVTDKAVKCGTFGASALEDRHLATGDFEGNLCLWDLECMKEPITSFKGHGDLINAIDGAGGLGLGEGAQEIATASRDGKVKVWDLRVKGKPVVCVEHEVEKMKRDAWAVALGNSHSNADRMLVSGYENGDLKLFDLRTMRLFWETELTTGVCSLQFDRKDIEMNKLLATCLEGKMHVWDMRTFNEKTGFAEIRKGHEKSTVWSGKHLPQNRDVFVTCHGNSELCLWQYKYPEKRARKNEASGEQEGIAGELVKLQDAHLGDQPIGSFSWSPDKCGLGLCTSFDQKIRTIIVTKLNTL